MKDAQGNGAAAEAEVNQDDSYAAALRKQAGDEKKARIEASERRLEKAKAELKAAEADLAKVKKENS